MKDKKLPLSSDYQPDPYQALTPQLAIDLRIAEERLRQARYSFNLALGMAATSALIGFAGVGLVLLGKASEGTITTTGGLASSAYCLQQLAKDTNDRLDKLEDDS